MSPLAVPLGTPAVAHHLPSALASLALLLLMGPLMALAMRVTWHTLSPRTRHLHAEFPVQEFLTVVPLVSLALWTLTLLLLSALPLHLPLALGSDDLRRSLYLCVGWPALLFMLLWIGGTRLNPWLTGAGRHAAFAPVVLGWMGAQVTHDLLPRLQVAPRLEAREPLMWAVLVVATALGWLAARGAGTHRIRWMASGLCLVLALSAPAWSIALPGSLLYVGAPQAVTLPWVALSCGSALALLLGLYLYSAQQGRVHRRLHQQAEALHADAETEAAAGTGLGRHATPPAASVLRWQERLRKQFAQRDALHDRVLACSSIATWMFEPSDRKLRLRGQRWSTEGAEAPGKGPEWLARHMHPDDASMLNAVLAYEPGQRNGFDLRCRMHSDTAAGGWLPVRWQGRVWQRDAMGYPQKWVGVMVDETQVSGSAQGLGSENRLFSEGPVVMVRWLFSPERHRLTELDFISPNVEALWGHELEDLHGMNRWSQVVAADDVLPLTRRLSRAMHRQTADVHHELRVQFRDGRAVWHSLFARVETQGGQGLITGFIVDIDSFKREEQRAREQARQLHELIGELERAKAETVILRESSEFLNSAETLDEAFSIISRAAMAIFPDWAGVLAGTQEDGSLRLSGRWGAAEHFAEHFSAQDCWALRRSQTHHFVDAGHNLRCRHVHTPPGQAERPYLCIPMSAHGENVGSLHLMATQPMTQADMQGLIERSVHLGETLKLALSNLRLRTRLRAQATHDGLTGLYNRRHMDEQLPVEIRRTERERQPLSLAMIDVDHFKRFNDHHGHEAGDVVLRALGELLRQSVRPYDLPCRYGGEEMAVIMPGCTLKDAALRLEAVRQAAEAMQLVHQGRPLPHFTISIGVAQTHGEHDEQALLKLADEQLYLAKRQGRNQLCVAAPVY